MDLENAAEILLIVVSSVLTIFLVVLILLAIKLIKIMRALNRIVDKAEHIADKAESIGEFITKTSGPAVAVRTVVGMVSNLVQNVGDESGKNRRKGR